MKRIVYILLMFVILTAPSSAGCSSPNSVPQDAGISLRRSTAFGSLAPQGGTITSVIAGSGLSGGGTGGAVTLNVGAGAGITVAADTVSADVTYLQRIVTGTCVSPNAIRVIATDGTVTCTTGVLDTSNVAGTANTLAMFTGTNTVGNSPLLYTGGTTLSTVKSLAINTNKFTVDATTGNTLVGGTLGVTGLTTVTGGITGLPATTCAAGSFFTADSTTGTGTCTATGLTGLTTNQTIKALSSTTIGNAWAIDDGTSWGVSGKFLITEATGVTTVSGLLTAAASLVVTGSETISTTLGVTGLSTLTGGFTLGADSSANTHKITSLTDGASAQDVAAFHQIGDAINAAVTGTSTDIAVFTAAHAVGNYGGASSCSAGSYFTGFSASGASTCTSAGIGATETSGTTGSILFVKAGPVIGQDNANLFYDVSTARLGVGTASPSRTLHIKDAESGVTSIRAESTATNSISGMEFNTGGITYGIVGYSGSTVGIANSNNVLYANSTTAHPNWMMANDTRTEFDFGMTDGSTYVEMQNGSSAAASSSNTGRIRYNTTGQKLQFSANTATYADFVNVAAGAGTNTDLVIFTGGNTIANYAGSTPTACTTGQAVTGPALSAAGGLTATCTTLISGTNNTLTKFTGANTIGNAGITDDGTTVTTTEIVKVSTGSSGALGAVSNSRIIAESASGATYISMLGAAGADKAIVFNNPTSAADGSIVYDNGLLLRGLQFRTGGNSTQMTIDSTGAVAIKNGTLDMGSHKITSVTDGSSAQDAATINNLNMDINGTSTDLAIFSSAHVLGNFAGSTPSACAAGSFDTGDALSAAGALTHTCTATGLTSLTTNRLTKNLSATTIGDSAFSDDGTTFGKASIWTVTESNGNEKAFGTFEAGGIATLDSTLSVAGTTTIGSTGAGVIDVGADTSLATNAQNGWRMTAFSDGNMYFDTKENTGGKLFFRNGAGAVTAASQTWLTLTASGVATEWNGAATLDSTLAVSGLSTLTGGFSAGAQSDMTSHKIVNLTNGSSAQDAAAFGQIASGIAADFTGTTNVIPKRTGTTTYGDSSISDNGTTVATTEAMDIGTATAGTHTLEVAGVTQVTSALTDSGNTTGEIFITDTADAASSGGTLSLGIKLDDNSYKREAALKLLEVSGGNKGLGSLAISTRRLTTDTALTEAMRIAYGGWVGIGTTTNTTHTLEVNGDVVLDTTLDVSGAITHHTGNVVFNASTGFTEMGGAAFIDGNATLNNVSGVTTIGGAATLNSTEHVVGAVTFDSTLSSGTITATNGIILSATGENYVYTSLAASSGVQNINLDAAGTGGVVRINGNAGGLANSGTGGLIVYGGANGSTPEVSLGGTGTIDALGTITSSKSVSTSFGAGNSNMIVADTETSALGVGGSISFQGAYSGTSLTSAATIKAMKTNGTGGNASFDLAFGARLDGSGNTTEYMRIASTGAVTMGQNLSSGSVALTVTGNAANALSVVGRSLLAGDTQVSGTNTGQALVVGAYHGAVTDIADVYQLGPVRKNWALYSDDLQTGSAATNAGWAVVNSGSTLTYASSTDVTAPSTLTTVTGNIAKLTCASGGTACSAGGSDLRTVMTGSVASNGTFVSDLRSQTITFSVYLRMASGTNSAAVISLARYNDNSKTGTTCPALNSSTWTRCIATKTFDATSLTDNSELRAYVEPRIATTAMYAWGAQIEWGDHATPVQETGSAHGSGPNSYLSAGAPNYGVGNGTATGDLALGGFYAQGLGVGGTMQVPNGIITSAGDFYGRGNLTMLGSTVLGDSTSDTTAISGTTTIGVSGTGVLGLGGDTSLSTNAQNGLRWTVFGDGNNYIDAKTFSSGSTIFRTGGGAESGAAKTWLTVASSDGSTTWAHAATLSSTLNVAGLITGTAGETQSAATNTTAITAGNSHTGQTTDLIGTIVGTNSGTYDTTAGTLFAPAFYASATATRSAGGNNVNEVAYYATTGASSGSVNPFTFYGAGGGGMYNSGSLTIDGNVTLGVNGTKTVGIQGIATFTTSATFQQGVTGNNNYAGKHLEWPDEWMGFGVAKTVATWTGESIGSPSYELGGTGTAAQINDVAAVTTRPGIIQMSTGSTTTGGVSLTTSPNSVNFGDGNWDFTWVGGWQTLSSSAQGYATIIGFFDTPTAVNQTDGCYFLYDERNVATSGPNGTNTHNLSCWCANNGARTTYLLNGSGNSDESFAKGTVTIAALSYPSTNIRNLEIKMTGSTRAEFYNAGTKVCDINTNVPTGSTRLEGAGWMILKSVGSTASTVDTDATRLFVDLTTARSP